MRGDQEDLLASYTASADNVFIDFETVVQPGEYTGEAADEVALKFRVRSDGAWDDADLLRPESRLRPSSTTSPSASMGFVKTFDDFEAGSPVSWHPTDDVVSGVLDTPRADEISVQARPNPFNPRTGVFFSARSEVRVTVTVFNVLGQKVATLFRRGARPRPPVSCMGTREQASGPLSGPGGEWRRSGGGEGGATGVIRGSCCSLLVWYQRRRRPLRVHDAGQAASMGASA